MSKFKIEPSGIERQLNEQDFIVSKTDLKGRIVYGNRAFADFSGFSESEFMGQQHSLVRHPDMPRAVFKLLWDHMGQQQEVFAYVKNLSKDGSHYWVMANVTPSMDVQGQTIGYFSVRRKPNPKALNIIQPLYKEMLALENSGDARDGMKRSHEWLLDQLAKQNTHYDHFVMNLESL